MSVAGANRQEGRRPAGAVARFLRSAGPDRPSPEVAERSPRTWLAAALRSDVDREIRARTGFYLIPLGLLLGTGLFYGADWRLSPPLVAGLSLGLLAACSILRPGRVPRAILLCLGFVLAGQALSWVELARTGTTIFSGEATVRISGRVEWREEDERGRLRYVVAVEETERPTLSRPPERARILVSSRHEPIPIGGRYEGLVRLRPPAGPAFPGAHDFAYAPFFRGIGAYGFSLGAPAPAPPPDASGLSFAERIAALRVAIAERIRTSLPGAEGAVASALITGERAGIPDEVEEWLRVTSLAHVLSISGFHMALIAGFAMLTVRAAASAVPGLPLLVSTKKIAACAALLVATSYYFLAGDSVATQRSWIMLAIMLGAILFDRAAITLRNVAIAAVAVLVLNPHAVTTAGFQMSFAATAALVGAYGALVRRWSDAGSDRSAQRERGYVLAAALAVLALALSALIAGGATAPYGAYHFQRAATLGGIVANVATMPVFSFWVMPAGLVSVLSMPFGLDAVPLAVMGEGLSLVFRLAETLAGWFPDHATGLVPIPTLLLLTAAILTLCFFAGRLRLSAVPLALAGLLALLASRPLPELLIFEDGREVALLSEEGQISFLRERPNEFVARQWRRAFPQRAETADGLKTFVCTDGICRATTRSGLRVAWTQDYERTGMLCDTSDIAIVARAIRLEACRSGAHLVTLRTLRRTGSLAVAGRDADRRPAVSTSIDPTPREWNRHRHADWPEYWRAEKEPDQPNGPPTTPLESAATDGPDSL